MTFKWSSTLIVNSTFMTKIDLSSNPTWQSTILVTQANSLAFGLYAFNFQTNVTITKTSNILFQTNNITTYVQIIPSGLAVYGLENGVSSLLIGTQTIIQLEASLIFT
jgi:hypothetical protein